MKWVLFMQLAKDDIATYVLCTTRHNQIAGPIVPYDYLCGSHAVGQGLLLGKNRRLVTDELVEFEK